MWLSLRKKVVHIETKNASAGEMLYDNHPTKLSRFNE